MHILAVDDDPIILELLDAVIAQIPEFELTTADCAEAALVKIKRAKNPFDCFLLDIQMPVTSGIELCQNIRGIGAYRQTPILMITAMSDKRYIDDAFAAGATDYVTKPFDVTDVQTRLRIALQRARQVADTMNSFRITERGAYPLSEDGDHISLNEPVAIFDVDGLVESHALVNYLTQLSRSALFGSGVFAISIRRIDELHQKCSRYEFEGLIADVAEAISDCLRPHQFLLAYGGNGTYDCVIEGGHKPELDKLVNKINLQLHWMDLRFSNGDPMPVRVCSGQFARLIWRSGQNAIEALIAAHESAEHESVEVEQRLEDFWFMGRVAG